MTESTTTTKTTTKATEPKETYNPTLLKSLEKGLEKPENSLVCKKCGSGRRTDLDGNLFCPESDKNCPFL